MFLAVLSLQHFSVRHIKSLITQKLSKAPGDLQTLHVGSALPEMSALVSFL